MRCNRSGSENEDASRRNLNEQTPLREGRACSDPSEFYKCVIHNSQRICSFVIALVTQTVSLR